MPESASPKTRSLQGAEPVGVESLDVLNALSHVVNVEDEEAIDRVFAPLKQLANTVPDFVPTLCLAGVSHESCLSMENHSNQNIGPSQQQSAEMR